MSDERTERIRALAQRFCRETCAVMGEPPCWSVHGPWPPEGCGEPSCVDLARIAVDVLIPTPERSA